MRESPLPKTLWVGGYEFTLAIIDRSDDRLTGADGLTDATGSVGSIWICADLGTHRTVEVVLHEVTHAINWAYDVANEQDLADEEDIAEKHGSGWARLYLDNPKFVRWLTSAIERVRKARASA